MDEQTRKDLEEAVRQLRNLANENFAGSQENRLASTQTYLSGKGRGYELAADLIIRKFALSLSTAS